jgi:hypothetical protein
MILKQYFSQPNKTLDPTSLIHNLEVIKDGYLVGKGDNGFDIYKRNGRIKLYTLPGVPYGGFWSDKTNKLYICSNNKLYIINNKTFTSVTVLNMSGMNIGNRVSFAETLLAGAWNLLLANGELLCSTEGSSAVAPVTNIGSASIPTHVPQVVQLDGYTVIYGKDTNTFNFSYPWLFNRFDIGDEYNAEMAIDDILNINVLKRQLHIYGSNSIEVWENAGQAIDPFVRRVSSNFHENGLYAPETLTNIDSKGEAASIFMDKKRRIVQIKNGNAEVIGEMYDRYIAELADIQYSYATKIDARNSDLILFQFPQAELSLVLDPELKAWYEWGQWNESSGEYDMYDCSQSIYCKAWDMTIMLGRNDGSVYSMSPSYLSDNNSPIRFMFQTGRWDCGYFSKKKVSTGLYMSVKRGYGKETDHYAVPSLFHRNNDQGKGWSSYRQRSMGALGDYDNTIQIYKCGGSFYRRQHEVVISDACPVVISGFEEEVVVREQTA